MINIIVTHTVYKNLNLDHLVELVLVLGDDNLTIFRKTEEMTSSYMMDLNAKIQSEFKKYGFSAKYKLSDHIAKAEYCNHWFVPAIVKATGEQTLTMIGKPSRVLLFFNQIKHSAIVGSTISEKEKNLD